MSIRATVIGGSELAATAQVLGLLQVEPHHADVAVIDFRERAWVTAAAELPRDVPRVIVIGDGQRAILDALAFPQSSTTTSCEPAVLGPLIASVLPTRRRRATRSIVVTAVRGGAGRSLLVANLARRIAPTRPALALDLTGTGVLGWWLGATLSGWTELESLSEELNADHLAVISAEPMAGLRVVGGPPAAPSASLGRAALRASLALAELVLVDAPNLAEQRSRALLDEADRIFVLSHDDPVSLGALAALDLPQNAWLIASQSREASLAGHDVFRTLPRAEAAIAVAADGRRTIGGPLGRAYDELAELIALDAS